MLGCKGVNYIKYVSEQTACRSANRMYGSNDNKQIISKPYMAHCNKHCNTNKYISDNYFQELFHM